MSVCEFAVGMLIILEICTLVWAYEVKIDARHSEEKGEQQRRILKEWIETVLEDRDEDKEKARQLYKKLSGL